MTNPDYTHIDVVLDRSGSMQSIKKDTEGGFKTFLADQRSQPGKATIALAQFDSRYEVVYGPTNIKDAPRLVLVPRGSTALLDAMGRRITETGEWLKSLAEDERPGRVIMVIITDGEENSSKEWQLPAINELITKQQDKYGWVFMFLAANQDAIAAGHSFGIARGSSLTYDTANVQNTYAAASANITRTRSGLGSGSFTEDERSSAVTDAQ